MKNAFLLFAVILVVAALAWQSGSVNPIALVGGLLILGLVAAQWLLRWELPGWARVGGGPIGGTVWGVVFLMVAVLDLVPDPYRLPFQLLGLALAVVAAAMEVRIRARAANPVVEAADEARLDARPRT